MMVLRSKEPGSFPGSPTYQLCDLGQDTLSNPWVPHLQTENDNTTHPQRLNKTMHAKCLHYRQSAMFLGASLVAQLACNVGNLGSIPGLGRSPGEEKGYPLQYSDLENSKDCIVHGSQRAGHGWVTFTSLPNDWVVFFSLKQLDNLILFNVSFLAISCVMWGC